MPFCRSLFCSTHTHLSAGVGGKDIRVTSIEDGHGAAAEELTASGAELNWKGDELVSGFPSKVLHGDFFAGKALDGRGALSSPSAKSRKSIQRKALLTVVAAEVVDRSLSEHGVILELRLAEGRSVASNDDKLGLAGAESFKGRLVANCSRVN